MLIWQSPDCRIPDDDEWLARRFRRDANAVRLQVRPLISEFCQVQNRWVTQKRLTYEWKWRREKSKKNTAAANHRWHKEKDISERSTTVHDVRNATTLPYPIERKKEDTADAVLPLEKYEFESGVIRLCKKDFEKWKSAFPSLDLKAELLSLTVWANDQGQKWFFAVSSALAKRNREQKIKLEQAKAAGKGGLRHTLADPLAGII
jgi:uncharacterized protein YdaU (DUF1376 family)